MAEQTIQQNIIDDLLEGLNKQSIYFKSVDLTSVDNDKRIEILNQIGNIHTKLIAISNTDMTLTVQDIEMLKTQYLNLISNVGSGSGSGIPVKGDKGDPFLFSDFTLQQLTQLKGDKGDSYELTLKEQNTLNSLTGSHVDYLLRSSKAGLKTVKLISVGDSTQDVHNYFDVLTLYAQKLNLQVYNNAQSGQSGQDWKNNTDQVTLQQCIDNCIGLDGEDTIVFYSMGLNDYKNGATELEVKTWLIEGLNLLKIAKPKVNIILISPCLTANVTRNIGLSRVYSEISQELNLKLIDGTIPTKNIHLDTFFYADPTHPNIYGHERRIVYFFQQLLPSDLHKYIELKEKNTTNPPTISELFDGITESGFFNPGDGLAVPSATWLRVKNRISIDPNFILNIEHYGTKGDVLFYDKDDVFIGRFYLVASNVLNVRQIVVPVNAWFMRINITDSVSTYTNTKVSIKYFFATSKELATIGKILDGLCLDFPRPIPDTSSIKLDDNTISLKHLDFIKSGKNIFDKDSIKTGAYLSDTNIEGVSSTYAYSINFIPVEQLETYYTNIKLRFITYFDINKEVINLASHTFPILKGTFIVPSGSVFAKFSYYIEDNELTPLQIEKGSVPTSYESFGYYFNFPNGKKIKID